MRLIWEQVYPYVFASIAAVVWWRVGASLPTASVFLNASITIGSIITGFLSTSMAVVMTLDSPIMQRLRETDYIKDLTSFLGQGIWLSLSFSIWSLLGFFLDTQSTLFGVIWVASSVGAFFAFVRITRIMLKIIRRP